LAAALIGCSAGGDGATAPAQAHPVNPIPAGLWQPTIPALGNWVLIQSESGDWLGQGKTIVITPSDATPLFLVQDDPLITIIAGGWNGLFVPMASLGRLEKGYYPGATKIGPQDPDHGGFMWVGDGRGCTDVRGWFAIDAVAYSGDTLTSIDLRSEQHCDGAAAVLHGAFHWNR
jgi:hypothetical protein